MRFAFLLALVAVVSSAWAQGTLLIFSKTAGYRHQSIEVGRPAIVKLLESKGLAADTTENAGVFNDQDLAKYQAVIFFNTTGDVLDESQQESLTRFIQGGKGFVGVHAASDTEFDWPWYGGLVGAYFKSHPEQQTARLITGQEGSQIKFNAPPNWTRKDEWYNFYSISPDINVLFYLDEKSYKGGENGDRHPLVWYHEYDGGRSFYTGMGHTNESYSDPHFMNLLWAGIQYVLENH